MVKVLLTQVIVNACIIIVYILFGLAIPIVFNLAIPNIFIFSWFISPIIAMFLLSLGLKRLKITKAKAYIIGAFILNFIYICIYTWMESLRQRIDGDFMDFRGLVFVAFGIGQIIGVVATFLYFNISDVRRNQ